MRAIQPLLDRPSPLPITKEAPIDPKDVARSTAILSKHRAALERLPGVVGADIVRAADGQPAIVAYVASEEVREAYAGVKVALPSGNAVRFRVAE